jgi:hypothetical protein
MATTIPKSIRMKHPAKDTPSKIPLTKLYVPPNCFKHHVQNKEGWIKLAKRYGVDVKELIFINFRTVNPEVVNWYLWHLVGCRNTTKDQKNLMFSSSDKLHGTGYIWIPEHHVNMPDQPLVGELPPARSNLQEVYWTTHLKEKEIGDPFGKPQFNPPGPWKRVKSILCYSAGISNVEVRVDRRGSFQKTYWIMPGLSYVVGQSIIIDYRYQPRSKPSLTPTFIWPESPKSAQDLYEKGALLNPPKWATWCREKQWLALEELKKDPRYR